MTLRSGVKKFLIFLNTHNIPLIIISQGIGNFGKEFLEMNECNFNNIYFSSNMIKFENGIASGNEGNIIHSFNKDETSLPENIKEKIKNRHQVLLLGDELSDLKMANITKEKEILKLAFLTEKHKDDLETYNNHFDIVCSDDISYNEIGNLLFQDYK